MYVCMIQHPLPYTALSAHGTNCSADGFYARTHINESYLCYYVVCRSKLAEACGNVCFYRACDSGWAAFFRFSKIQKIDNGFLFLYQVQVPV